jgi:uncharacterized protein with HEPN domain
MSELDSVRLREVFDAARRVSRFTVGKTFEMLEQDEVYAFALLHAVQVVGEAASKVAQDTQRRLLQIQWREMIAMRNIIVHDYLTTRYDMLWEAATVDVPILIAHLEAILPPVSNEQVSQTSDDL